MSVSSSDLSTITGSASLSCTISPAGTTNAACFVSPPAAKTSVDARAISLLNVDMLCDGRLSASNRNTQSASAYASSIATLRSMLMGR